MKINNILPIRNNNFEICNHKHKNQELEYKQVNQLYNNVSYMPFLGGYSIDLKETYAKMPDNQYPSMDIKNGIEKILKENNPSGKTLYDVHFDKYKGINDCYSLDELKEKYKEFSDVKSANDVMAQKGSFIDRFQKDELHAFSSDEDLTLQLIKLYWGQGFSLNDLSSHIKKFEGNGINLHSTFEKLNIPFMKPRYANVLKLSNKKYNEEQSQYLSIKVKEAREAKLQRAEGEPVVIPSGELSEAHKKHISEGLKKFYIENPDRLFSMSKRQKEFYSEHPEKREEMSKVMLYAWNKTQEGRSILKGINKFFKKQNRKISLEQLTMQNDMDKETKTLLNKFWDRNNWAKEKMSFAVKKGYKYVKEEEKIDFKGETIPGVVSVVKIMPDQIIEQITTWAKENNMSCNKDHIAKAYVILNTKKQSEIEKQIRSNTSSYNDILAYYEHIHPESSQRCADTMILNLMNFYMQLKLCPQLLPEPFKSDEDKTNLAIEIFRKTTADMGLFKFDEKTKNILEKRQIDIKKMKECYPRILTQFGETFGYKIVSHLDDELNDKYQQVLNIYKNNQ